MFLFCPMVYATIWPVNMFFGDANARHSILVAIAARGRNRVVSKLKTRDPRRFKYVIADLIRNLNDTYSLVLT